MGWTRRPWILAAVLTGIGVLVVALFVLLVHGGGASRSAGRTEPPPQTSSPSSAAATGNSSPPPSAIASASASTSGLPVGVPVPLTALDGAAVTSPVTVTAPAGTTGARWVVDGAFLEKDSGPPYAVTLQLPPGQHKLVARLETKAGRQDVRATFTVTRAAPSSGSSSPPGQGASNPAQGIPPLPSPTRTVPVATEDQLRAAIADARPGDAIQLADGTYEGPQLDAAASGTASAPIVLTGSRRAVITTGDTKGGGYALHVTGSFWRLVGFTVQRAKKGIVLDGSTGTILQRLDVGVIGQEAIHFRSSSRDGAVVDCDVHDTGLASPQFGEGVYVGSAHSNWSSTRGSSAPYGSDGGTGPDRSDAVLIEGNRIYDTAAEGVDAKEGTTGGVIRGNAFTNAGTSGQNSADSWVDVKGNGWLVEGNRGSGTLADAFQVHQVYPGWGRDNTFRDNTVTGGVPGFVVGVYPPSSPAGNTVSCTDRGAAKGSSNVSCSG